MICHTDLNDSRQLIIRLRKFYMAQRELSQALLEAKPLGICKTTISDPTKFDIKSLDLILKSGKAATRLITTLSNASLKETL